MVMAAIVGWTCLPAVDQQPPPIAVFSANLLLHPGQVATVPMEFVLPGTASFVPQSVERSCDCVSTGPLPATVPGGTTTAWTALIQGGESPGVRSVRIRSVGRCGSAPASLQAVIRYQVEDYLTRGDGTWGLVDLGVGMAGTPLATVVAFAPGRHPARWDRVQAVPEEEEEEEDGGSWIASPVRGKDGLSLTVAFTPGRTCGIISNQLRFSFFEGQDSLPYHPRLPVQARVDGGILADPSQVLMGSVAVGGAITAGVVLLPRHAEAPIPGLIGITSTDGSRMQVDVQVQDGAIRLDLTVHGRPPIGRASGHLDVRFADGAGTVLRIPYLAAVTSPPR